MAPKKTILEIINEIVASDDPSPVVLPLMCGAGKSQAIAAKIKDSIVKNEGLLVVTDRTSRFDDYLNPMDENVKSFLVANSDKIAVLKASTKYQYQETHSRYPVLLMTTQRYFSMEKEEILQYLSWGDNQQRKLILFDEKPELYFQFNLDLAAINKLEAAFILGIKGNEEKKHRYLLEYWNSFKNSFLFRLAMFSNAYPDKDSYSFFSGFDINDEPLHLEGIDTSSFNDIDRDNYQSIVSYEDANIKRPADFKEYIKENSIAMYHYNKCDAVKTLRAIQLFQRRSTLYSYWPRNSYENESSFSVIQNEKEKLVDIPSRVIILDVTADLSIDYQQDYLHIDTESSLPYNRKIPNLHIKLVKMDTSRRKIQPISRDEFETLVSIIRKDSNENCHCIFTYKAIVDGLKADPEGEDDKKNENTLDYLGNLKGRNDFQKYHVFGQLGLNMKPRSVYLSMLYEQQTEKREALIQVDTLESKKGANIIESYTKKTEFKEAIYKDILADIEQNIFRSPIRSAGCTDSVIYYLFFEFDEHPLLKKLIEDRFCEKYGSQVTTIDPSNFLGVKKAQKRKQTNGKKTYVQQVLKYINTLDINCQFTKKDVRKATQLTEKQMERALRNKDLKKIFIDWRVDEKKGIYVKRYQIIG